MSKELETARQRMTLLRDAVVERRSEIAKALPRGLDADRLTRIALTELHRTPKLALCTASSFYAAILQCAQIGLYPDGITAQAYLVPRRRKGAWEVLLIPGYKGLMALAWRSERILGIQPHAVRRGDDFGYRLGLDPELHHWPFEPEEGADEERPITHVYAIAHLRGQSVPQFEVMTRLEIDRSRTRSAASESGPWVTDYEAMALKTVLRRLCKYLPCSTELQMAVALDERAEAGLPQLLPEEKILEPEVSIEPSPEEPEPTEPPPLEWKKEVCPGCERHRSVVRDHGHHAECPAGSLEP